MYVGLDVFRAQTFRHVTSGQTWILHVLKFEQLWEHCLLMEAR
jgi:hypothetical protein